jgi:hypothetical protein
LAVLTETCAKTDWQIHADCPMRNYFHLVLETPEANLVVGMKWLLRFIRSDSISGCINRRSSLVTPFCKLGITGE